MRKSEERREEKRREEKKREEKRREEKKRKLSLAVGIGLIRDQERDSLTYKRFAREIILNPTDHVAFA